MWWKGGGGHYILTAIKSSGHYLPLHVLAEHLKWNTDGKEISHYTTRKHLKKKKKIKKTIKK